MNNERKELFSEKVLAGKRTYFFDVKETVDKEKYLVISESRPGGEKSFVHSRIMVFEEHINDFIQGLKKALNFFRQNNQPKTHTLEQIRQKYPNAYAKWTETDDVQLRDEYLKGKTIEELVKIFKRQTGAIRSRLEKLNLL